MKIIVIGFICILLISIFTAIPALEIKSEKLSDDGLPDIAFAKLVASYSTYDKKITINYDTINKGDSYSSNVPIKFYIEFFTDNNPTYFLRDELPVIDLDPYLYRHGEGFGSLYSNYLNEKPETITLKIRDTNFPESNKDNNECTTELTSQVTVYGSVYKEENEKLIGLGDKMIYPLNSISQKTETNQDGSYCLSILPKEPFEESHTYDLMVVISTNPYLYCLKRTDSVIAGNEVELDFIVTSQPIKPSISGRHIFKVGTTQTFSISSTDPEGDQLYYWIRWRAEDNLERFGPYSSGEVIEISHQWNKADQMNTMTVFSADSGGLLSKDAYLNYQVLKGKNKVAKNLLMYYLNKFIIYNIINYRSLI